jgi:hypothetical protein
MNKHTPGPWEIQWTDMWCPETDDWIPEKTFAEHIRASGDGEFYERESICGTCDGCNLIKAANARLIAAAPDLLSALQEINKRLQDHPAFPRDFSGLEAEDIEEPDGDSAEFKYLSDIAQAAIDKATGETE